jgi:hypothetical protein
MPLRVAKGGKLPSAENFLLTGYQGVQKSALTVKRHFAATLVERWLVNPEEASEASLAQRKENENGSKEEGESQRQGQEESQEEGQEVSFLLWLRPLQAAVLREGRRKSPFSFSFRDEGLTLRPDSPICCGVYFGRTVPSTAGMPPAQEN